MTKYDYFWKNGLPYGRENCSKTTPCTYKIASDPYHKHVTVEEYKNGEFTRIIYDSRLLNFRHLRPENQTAWQKTAIDENSAWIRNEHDHLLYREVYHFTEGLCTKTELFSAHGIHLATHRLFYECLGDEYNGALLKDITGRPVVLKKYEEESGEFTQLLSTETNFSHALSVC